MTGENLRKVNKASDKLRGVWMVFDGQMVFTSGIEGQVHKSLFLPPRTSSVTKKLPLSH